MPPRRVQLRHLIMAAIVGLGTIASVGGIDDAEDADSETPREAGTGFEIASEPASPSSTSSSAAPLDNQSDDAAAANKPSASEGGGEEEPDPAPVDCLVTEPEGLVWRLAFADDFDTASVESAAWRIYDSAGNAGFGLRRPEAIETADGHLVITAAMVGDDLVSGGMAHRADQVYGRWEFRVRTDPDPSGATSGVALTWPRSENWPIDGENDMYETGRDPDRTPFMTFIHYGADNLQESLTHEADGTAWHVMAMEWTEDRIALYRDGRHVGEINDPDVIPDVAHHMTIQLDAWADTMGDPVQMEVDWVRVHRYDPAATSC